MEQKRQFSLAYLFLIVFWAAVALGLWRLAPALSGYGMPPAGGLPGIELETIADVFAWAAAGATIGGFFRRMRIGATIAASMGMLLFTFLWAVEELLFWFTPI
jgi:hypothetical protein